MRVLSRVSAALVLAGGLVVATGPIADAAPVDCQYTKSKKLVTLSIDNVTSAWIDLEREVGTTRIGYTLEGNAWHGCEGARTTNTDKIKVEGSTLSEEIAIDLENGAFAPGASRENRGASEIEFVLDLGDGTDSVELVGGRGADRLGFVAAGRATLNGDDDVDVTIGGVDRWTLIGNDGGDVLDGSGAPRVYAYGGAGADRLVGGPGRDSLYGDNNGEPGAGDALSGGAGDDSLYGFLGNDVLRGEAGDDDLSGYEDRDVMNGGDGDDYLYTMSTRDGADDVVGGPGYDRADYSSRSSNVKLILDGKANDGAKNEGDNLSPSIEAITGGAGNDTLVGTAQGNDINGNDGRDELRGLVGDDDLDGDDGDDVMRGGPGDEYFGSEPGDDKYFGDDGDDSMWTGSSADGNDVYSGGPGNDVVDYSSRSAALSIDVTETRNDGNVLGGENDYVYPDFEYLYGGSASDIIWGSKADEYITGGSGSGSDQLRGLGGTDTLVGNDGNDLLIGDEGYDTFYGGNGDDQFEAADQGEDYVDCGASAGDIVTTMDSVDYVTGCEAVPA